MCFLFDGNYYLRMPVDLIEHTMTLLKKYAVFSKVEITDASDVLIGLGIASDDIDALEVTDCTLMKIPGPLPRYELYGKPKTIDTYWKKLIGQSTEKDPTFWRTLDIQSGIANIYVDTHGLFLPHRLNYIELDAINFEKGCFLGQEVIARLHYRSQTKHHCYPVKIDTEAPLTRGMRIHPIDQKNAIGDLVDFVDTTALIIMHDDYRYDGKVRIGEQAAVISGLRQ